MVVEACPVPIILYNVPGRTGVNMDADTTLRIARLSEKVVAIKEAAGDLSQFGKIIKNAPDYFKVISGDDGLILPAISIGAIGVISVIANALPMRLSQLTYASLNGTMEIAGQLQLQIGEMLKLIFREGNPGGVKALMKIMKLAENQVRLPLVPVSAETYSMIESELKNLH
jgi:4-hydroxy-tetrahydrodipicolinate synthase